MRIFSLIFALAAMLAAPLAAQVSLPGVRLPGVGEVIQPLRETVDRTAEAARREADDLVRARLRMIDRLVSRNRNIIELDARGEPARRGEMLVMDAGPELEKRLARSGFALISRERVEGLDFYVARLRTPDGMTLAEAEVELRGLLPQAEISADHLHFQSGTAESPALAIASAAGSTHGKSAPVGMIDGAPGAVVPVAETRGFAKGAPYPSNHGSAVASLLASAGANEIRVADVYGTDKAGGNALAMVKGLGWLIARGSKVVTISLVGPRNAVLERAIAAAQRKGVVVVASVGNDGPAAPPAFPASYDGVVAVTAVDGKRRALIEAGRALHLDYAAPGADIRGLNAKGKRFRLRGTSFATPLVAARVAHALGAGRNWRGALDREAEDLGRKGPDDVYGRGLVCGSCRGR